MTPKKTATVLYPLNGILRKILLKNTSEIKLVLDATEFFK